jgi:hypothetical protein
MKGRLWFIGIKLKAVLPCGSCGLYRRLFYQIEGFGIIWNAAI